MIGYGFGAIVGSGVFDFTVCLGIASIFSFYSHKSKIRFKLKALLRDIYIYCITLFFLVLIMWDYKVTTSEALLLFLLWPITALYTISDKP